MLPPQGAQRGREARSRRLTRGIEGERDLADEIFAPGHRRGVLGATAMFVAMRVSATLEMGRKGPMGTAMVKPFLSSWLRAVEVSQPP